MKANYLSCCVSPCKTLQAMFDAEYFNGRYTRTAGREIKRAIIESGEFDNFAMFKDWHVRVYRLKFNGQLYAVVVHSAIEHLFEIN